MRVQLARGIFTLLLLVFQVLGSFPRAGSQGQFPSGRFPGGSFPTRIFTNQAVSQEAVSQEADSQLGSFPARIFPNQAVFKEADFQLGRFPTRQFPMRHFPKVTKIASYEPCVVFLINAIRKLSCLKKKKYLFNSHTKNNTR